MNFYLTVVSPNPSFLKTCDGTDCGQYITKTLLSHPLSIIFTRQRSIISTKDDVSIDLLTSNIIGAVISERDITISNSIRISIYDRNSPEYVVGNAFFIMVAKDDCTGSKTFNKAIAINPFQIDKTRIDIKTDINLLECDLPYYFEFTRTLKVNIY